MLQDQNQRSLAGDRDVEQNLHELKELAVRTREVLETGDLRGFGELLTAQWQHKKRRSPTTSNDTIDQLFELGMANGALGGKLVGAGGGGFLMFYAEEKVRLRHAMLQAGMREVHFQFDFEGTRVVIQ